jgi:serine protease Do
MELSNTISKFRYIFIGTLATTALLYGYAFSQKSSSLIEVGSPNGPQVVSAAPAPKDTVLPNFSEIAAQQGPAVVNVSVSGTVK